MPIRFEVYSGLIHAHHEDGQKIFCMDAIELVKQLEQARLKTKNIGLPVVIELLSLNTDLVAA